MNKKEKKILSCGSDCPVKASLNLLGGKWTMMIIYQIGDDVMRYGELKKIIPSISEKMLIQELKMLVENKLVNKKSYPEIPPKVEYTLTELGLKTIPIIEKLLKFGKENLLKS